MTCRNLIRCLSVVILVASAFATVNVSSPAIGGIVGSPVHYAATASTTCSKGVASMGVYVDSKLVFVVNGKSLATDLNISAGSHNTVVEEWDYCGGATFTKVPITVSNQTGVWVTSPVGGGVNSPVNYVATSTTSCSKGIASMGVYVNNKLNYTVQGSKLNTSVTLSPGKYDTVVQEWDHCGGSAFKHVAITVNGSGNTFSNLQASGGWTGYGEFPPKYDICTNCGPGVTWSMNKGINSPSLSGNATKFSIGGTTPYSDVLWTNPLIGTYSSQGIPDTGHKIIPNLHHFTYDLYFYGTNLELSQVLEFDINQYFNTMGFTWGTQCRIAGGHIWDIWDNVNWHWVSTGVPCNPVNNTWNHLTLEMERTSDNKLLYHAITLNGARSVIDRYYPPFSVGNWYGITANYQMDGNYKQSPHSVYVDKFSFTYW
jgi:hypothetical protein